MWSVITTIVLWAINTFIANGKKKEEMAQKYRNYLNEREKRVVKMETHKNRYDALRAKVDKAVEEYNRK